jgi:hypothetical protein
VGCKAFSTLHTGKIAEKRRKTGKVKNMKHLPPLFQHTLYDFKG